MKLNRIHLTTGMSTVIVFLGTGLYMRMNFPQLYDENEAIRYLFRANHVYILFSGLLNILLGLYGSFSGLQKRRRLQIAGSWMLLLAVPFFVAAFVFEPPLALPYRPLTLAGAVTAFVGTMLHLIGGYRKPEDQKKETPRG
ncbi:MAG: hypothetical protein HYW57_08845 [Ignavibacteriales bacterium]|nr:hypothetical protein [Ignavibacteriales bacterium]